MLKYINQLYINQLYYLDCIIYNQSILSSIVLYITKVYYVHIRKKIGLSDSPKWRQHLLRQLPACMGRSQPIGVSLP